MSSPGGATWYVHRLRAMSPAEVAWRVGQAAAIRSGRGRLTTSGPVPAVADWDSAYAGFRGCRSRPLLLDRSRALEIARTRPADVERLVAAAERALLPELEYFGHGSVRPSTPLDWNYDPVTGVHWPTAPASSIDHRTAGGDPKWIWELNRLQHLCWLSEAWIFTGREEFAGAALAQLDSWLVQNPPGRGIAWRGAFEVGVRAVSVSIALQGLRDAPLLDLVLFRRVVDMLAAGADRCWRARSRYSSANNHLIGEMAGLFVVAAMFPELEGAPDWERRALETLCREAARQILPDGAGAEQAIGYQVFTAELLGVVVALLRARGDVPPASVVDAIDRSATYLATLVDGGHPEPRYGDDDEGFALRLDADTAPSVRRHLASAAALTGNAAAARNGEPGLAAAWLAAIPGVPASRDSEAPVRSTYAEHGGLVVLRAPGRRTTMDVGPLGYLSIAAHGHADALSVTVTSQGQELVGDPGTGSYYAHPEWRRAHRGTRTHATVTVDDQDQSEMGGPFLWTRHARVRVRHVDLERGVVDAEHDGYRRLRSPVTHRRWLVAPDEWPAVLVLDLVHGSGEHEVRTSWPLHPSLDVEQVRNAHVARREGTAVLRLSHALASPGREVVPVLGAERGDEVTHRGWWSERLESRSPAWLLSAAWRGTVPLAAATLLTPDPAGEGDDLALDWAAGRITATWSTPGCSYEVVVEPSRDGVVRAGRRTVAGG